MVRYKFIFATILAVVMVTFSGINKTLFAQDRITNSLGMEMVRIEPGSFERGSDQSNQQLFFDERPVHTVNISEPFYMSSTPVTNAQYEQFDQEHEKLRGKW